MNPFSRRSLPVGKRPRPRFPTDSGPNAADTPGDTPNGSATAPGAPAARRTARRRQDLEIARLAVPAFAALVAEPVFLLADAAIVGHLGTSALAALGIAGAVVQAVVGLFVFLAYGTTSSVARSVGAGRIEAALRAGVDGMWLALALGACVAALTIAAAPPLVAAFGPEGAVAGPATDYLRIAAIGIPSLLVVFATTGVLRGLQDTMTPLVVAVGANLANIGLNLFFVYGVGWGLAGSAVGTTLAQTGAAVVLAASVVRGARRAGVPLGWRRSGLLTALRDGVPLLVRTLTLRVALLIATFVATSIGTVAVAAHSVAFTVWTFLAFALDAVAIAGQAITGRLLGAQDAPGTRAATGRMMLWGAVLGCVFGAALFLGRPLLVVLFTPDPAVQDLLSDVLLVAALQQPVAGVVFVLDGVLIGAGDGRYLAWAGLVNLVAFVPLALAVLAAGVGLVALWWALTGYLLTRLATLLWRERGDAWLVLGDKPGGAVTG